MIRLLAALAFLTGPASGERGAPPCVRPLRAGMQVQGSVRICPGRYRIPDPTERGVLIVVGSGAELDLSGVILESGDTAASAFVGTGVVVQGVDGVTISGGTIRGYRFGIRVEGGRDHIVSDIDLSGSRRQNLLSTTVRADPADQLSLVDTLVFQAYGAGILVRNATRVLVTRAIARGAQNGIAFIGVRESYLADNDVSRNSGWGISLWASGQNIIARNRANAVRRCPIVGLACGAAAILIRQRSDSNTIADNDLTDSSDGLTVIGEEEDVAASVGTVAMRNDASRALHHAFRVSSGWGNSFVDNRADSAEYAFVLNDVSTTVVRGNTMLGVHQVGVSVQHGTANTIEANTIVDAKIGIRLFASDTTRPINRDDRLDDNVLARLGQGIVLERTGQAHVRGNLFDEVGEGLVVDPFGHSTEVVGNVFLRATKWFIRAPDLVAGGNYWGAPTAEAASAKVSGRVSVQPWTSAAAVGY